MYIVGSKRADMLNGCILNTVFQVTPEPVSVAVSINRGCLTHEYVSQSGVFSVCVLSQQTPMSFIGRFGFRSGRDIDKFEGVNYRTGQTGAPIITDNTVAFLEAEVVDRIDVVKHTVFIGRILACATLAADKEPMTYAYYRQVKRGWTPETAATYQKTEVKAGDSTAGEEK